MKKEKKTSLPEKTFPENEEIPYGWNEGTLSDLIGSDGVFVDGDWIDSKDQDPNGDVRLVQLADIGDGFFRDKSHRFLTKEKSAELNCTFLQKGDLLISRMGDPLGKCCIFPETEKLSVAAVDICIVRPGNSGTDIKWLMHQINSPNFRNKIDLFERGTTRTRISRKNLAKIPFPLPPLAEQQRIVARVEALLTQVNATRDRLNRVPVIMKKFRQAVLAAACSGRLTEGWREEHPLKEIEISNNLCEHEELFEIPLQWKWALLPNLGYVKRGRSKNRPRNAPHLFGGKYPFIQTGDISQSSGRITSHHQTYSEEGLAQSKLWAEKTVCITIAANIAESAILTYPACFPDSVVGFIADDSLCVPEYIEFFMRLAKRDLSQFAPATAQKNINIEILNEVNVPLPPLAEQHEIVRRVGLLFERADAIDREVAAAGRRCERLTQAVLAKAFAGRL